ncbi:Maf family protein [Planctomicrobium piriforme]|uniref:dTTP/UTP pyrophosphatase n=1 Tax=Planctomicrobium piriforme TaxID=1576369 RepID=A0A1I3C6V3_9PLAN|nr:Maf family protein [Planctomicrobium piriforme]SFH70056.1 septum formation protein [Planctomicrobium piriforme]
MPDAATGPVLLGSRSPRRLELLSLLIPADQIQVSPPEDESEQGFDDVHTLAQIDERVLAIASRKRDLVAEAWLTRPWRLLLTADTVVIVRDDSGQPVVLGKPDGERWQATVRDWFTRYYLGRPHEVATAVCLRTADGREESFVERTKVEFRTASPELLEWYIATEEPLGKAGGYGLQGAGGMFVQSVTGSPSNVIGLPVERIWQTLNEWELIR